MPPFVFYGSPFPPLNTFFFKSQNCEFISQNYDFLTRNCEFVSCNYEKKSQNCEIKSRNNLFLFCIQWRKPFHRKVPKQNCLKSRPWFEFEDNA